jgi:hypothetical protein
MLEVLVSSAILLTVVGMALSLYGDSNKTVGDSMKITDVAMEANRLDAFLARELRSARITEVYSPWGNLAHNTSVIYQQVTGLDFAAGGPELGPLREIRFVYDAGELGGVANQDDDGDGLIDEGFIAIYEDAGGLDGLFAITPNASSTSERVVVLVENVSDQIRFSFVDPDGVTPGGDANTSGRNGLERGGSEDFRVSFAVMGRLPRSATPEIHSAQRTLKIALRN